MKHAPAPSPGRWRAMAATWAATRAATWTAACAASATALLAACGTPARAPVTLVPEVDVSRFMGDWYVIANIPTYFERGAHNAVESYQLDPDGSIATTFTFRDGAFDGPLKTYRPRGFVNTDVPGNAVWGMRFVWPIKADYRISYLSADYGQTVVTRQARDHVWIMARTPQISEAEYQRLVQFVATQGYDVSQLQKVPQQPRR